MVIMDTLKDKTIILKKLTSPEFMEFISRFSIYNEDFMYFRRVDVLS